MGGTESSYSSINNDGSVFDAGKQEVDSFIWCIHSYRSQEVMINTQISMPAKKSITWIILVNMTYSAIHCRRISFQQPHLGEPKMQ